jgi:serine/threonine-protein kinase
MAGVRRLITNRRFVLADDVVILPALEAPDSVRGQLDYDKDDHIVTRPRTRTPSRLIDANLARLLDHFRSSKTIVDAVLEFAKGSSADPEETLESCYPALQRLVHERFLVDADTGDRESIRPSLDVGQRVGGFEVVASIQILEDTETYRVRGAAGEPGALKIGRPGHAARVRHMLDREVAVLKHVEGGPVPRLLRSGRFEQRPYLVAEWKDGRAADRAAHELRARDDGRGLLRLCVAILDAYAELHARGVIHSDVHPRNVLVAQDGAVTVIDFGLARFPAGKAPERGGVAYYFEPEYAAARRARRRLPLSTAAGEQYGLAAMLYQLISGRNYVEFSPEKHEMLRQIAEEPPARFADHGLEAWPAVEGVLGRALAKPPAERFESVARFADALRDVAPPPPAPAAARARAAEELLQRVLARVGPDGTELDTGVNGAPRSSVNYGAAGVAYALYRIACLRGDAALLSCADVWSNRALDERARPDAFRNDEIEVSPKTVGTVSAFHAESGLHAVQALVSQAMGDAVSADRSAAAFAAGCVADCENLDLTLGRSSLLIAGALLLASLGDDSPAREAIRRSVDTVMDGIWERVDACAPIPECTTLRFLGIAHGWAGFLYAALRWCEASGRPPPQAMGRRLDELAGCAEPIGGGVRWKSRVPGRDARDFYYMPGWCNGSAGFVFLWLLAARRFEGHGFAEVGLKAAQHAWEDPSIAGNLCCGDAGRAYAMLAAYKHTGERDWLVRASALAERAARGIANLTANRDSLYKGDVGVGLLAADLARPDAACMPFFEAEG